jgi:hypothetical protein
MKRIYAKPTLAKSQVTLQAVTASGASTGTGGNGTD